MKAEYSSWNNMKQRCTNKKREDYSRYGGRGIKFCDRWNNFENFFEDMGLKPSRSHSIDRINNEGNYEKIEGNLKTQLQYIKEFA